MARASESQEGYSAFGGGLGKAWLRVLAPYDSDARDGTGLVDRPGGLVLEAVGASGAVTTYWLWVDRNGLLHSKTSEPTDEDETTSIMAPKNITVSTIGIHPNVSIPSGSTINVATTIAGVAAGDLVLLEFPTMTGATPNPSVRIVTVFPTVTTDTITVRFLNPTTSAVIPGAQTYRYVWFDLT